MEERKTPTEMKKNRLERLAGIIQRESKKLDNANISRMYKFHKTWLNCSEQAKSCLGEEYVEKMDNVVREYIRIFQENNYDRLPTF